MLKVKNLKVGSVLSEAQFSIVTSIEKDKIVITDSNGNKGIKLSYEYAEKLLNSAEQFDKEEKLTQTELSELVRNNKNIAMSIYFQKADKEKTKKTFEAEKTAKIDEIKSANLKDVDKLLANLIDNPILNYVPGEMRLIKGYSLGTLDAHGRINFCDLEDKNIVKGVDPRTIDYVIVSNVKYIKK